MAKKPKNEKPLDPVSLSTWARLRSAGKSPEGAKPYAAEKMADAPKSKPKKSEAPA